MESAELRNWIVGMIRAHVSAVHVPGDPPGYATIVGEDEAARAIVAALSHSQDKG